ncbi:MAG: phosphoribosylanthranilate isomerase [Candidatus Melainabacteria bacterium]|nr:phosphoribosylanthranilate isomerase [Candidatus Melainabacteria bacterium]
MGTNIKICGITSLDDALAALDAGADYVGLIFAEGSPRRVEKAAAKEIIAAVEGRAKVVGVFKDQELDYVADLAQLLALDFIQCHGAESIDYVRELPARVIRTIELTGLDADDSNQEQTVQLSESKELIDMWQGDAAMMLFDRPKSLFDPNWYQRAVQQLIAIKPLPLPFFFAGGLSAENVGEVVDALEPFGVDVASSIESAPGKKDVVKMNDFCRAVKRGCGGVSACEP